MSRRLLSALVAAALVASVFPSASAAVPFDVIVYSGQSAPMTDDDSAGFTDDASQNFSFAVSRRTPTLVLKAFLENAIIEPGDSAVWLGDPRPSLLLARFNRQAGEIPQDVRYAGFTAPLFVNDNGQSAFRALLAGDGLNNNNDAALYVTNASGAHFAFREGDAAPNTNANFGDFTLAGLDNQGWAAVRTALQPASEGSAIFRASYVNEKRIVTRTGASAPGTQTTFSDFDTTVYSSTGHIAFEAGLSNVAANTQTGIWAGLPDNLFKIARQGDQATAGGLYFHYVELTSLRDNRIAFLADLRALPDGADAVASAIFGGAINAFDVLKTTGDQASGMPAGVVFTQFGAPSINGTGRIAFDADLAGPGITVANNHSVWTGIANDFTKIAQEGMQIPGTEVGTTFVSFDSASINDLGQSVFLADLAGGVPASSRGLFAYDPLGGLSLIARTGDEITLDYGHTATILGFEGQAQLNDRGEVVFQVDLSTGAVGPEAILRATIPVPEPAAWILAIALGGLVWLYTMRHGNCLT